MTSKFRQTSLKYLIKSGSVTGEQVCAIVYEQGVLPMDDSTYNGLLNGETNAFSWIKSKLESLELTPGELALEPCSAGAVVTNPNTGEVLACVSYPGYDNNRLSKRNGSFLLCAVEHGYVTDLLQQSDPGEDSTRFYL